VHRQFVAHAICALTFSIAAFANLSAHAANADAGKEKAVVCAGCHGDNGISQTENIPSLAGQPDQFLQWQLVFFRAGSRKNEQMQPVVEEINNEDIRNLGAYFSQLGHPRDRPTMIPKALHDYKAGQRVGGGVAAMADIAYSLNEEEITALAHYLAHLQ
jgi:cytochrome c553